MVVAKPAQAQRQCLSIDDRPDAPRLARRFVTDELGRRGAEPFVDDATLVVSELVANARQHGALPISVCVSGDQSAVRLEVTDGSSRTPVRPSHSVSNMTGRGLTLVGALASAWGVEPRPGGGKAVWAKFDGHRLSNDAADEAGIDDVLAQWTDDSPDVEPRHTVVLGNVPTDLLIEAKAHIDNLVREFSLAATGGETGDVDVPPHLAQLIETVVHGFADARDAIKRQALAAARRGSTQTTLTLQLPTSAAAAGEAYLAALDEADEYSRAARLLTLETPPDHRLFRRWYVRAVVRQLRELGAGKAPTPVRSFEDTLVGEVRRLWTAQRTSERAARLQRVTAALARARTPEDVATVVVSEGVQALGASGGGILVPAGDGEHIAVPGVVGYGAELVGALREERLNAPLPAATAIRTGEAYWLETQEERDRMFPALRGFEASTVSMCAVPLIVGDRTIGALRFSFLSRKLFDSDEREFVLALAALTAQTLQRTELYEAEREAALDLQRALLPSVVPQVPGWDVAAYYSPAGDQEAGGDFYDILELGGGRTIAIVGDVMGRGVEAAAAMAEIRSTIRAYAIDDPAPGGVFERVDRFFSTVEGEQLVTVLYFLFDRRTDVVEIANAGHLPPLLVTAESTTQIDCTAGPPFGVPTSDRRSTRVAVRPGATLVAVTDGLVERRGEDIDDGVSRLITATREKPSASARELLDHVIASAAGSTVHDDDVTAVVLRRRTDAP